MSDDVPVRFCLVCGEQFTRATGQPLTVHGEGDYHVTCWMARAEALARPKEVSHAS